MSCADVRGRPRGGVLRPESRDRSCPWASEFSQTVSCATAVTRLAASKPERRFFRGFGRPHGARLRFSRGARIGLVGRSLWCTSKRPHLLSRLPLRSALSENGVPGSQPYSRFRKGRAPRTGGGWADPPGSRDRLHRQRNPAAAAGLSATEARAIVSAVLVARKSSSVVALDWPIGSACPVPRSCRPTINFEGGGKGKGEGFLLREGRRGKGRVLTEGYRGKDAQAREPMRDRRRAGAAHIRRPSEIGCGKSGFVTTVRRGKAFPKSGPGPGAV